jgi:hypothetical protein
MVDYKCRKYLKQVESHIEIYNNKGTQYKLKLAETSDELDSMPYETAKERISKYLELIEENLGEYYTEFNGLINNIDEETLKNDAEGEYKWQEHKYLEMISSKGLFYVEVLNNENDFLGFFSFNITNDSLIKNEDSHVNKKVKLSFFDKPKGRIEKKNIFYLMEIQLKKKASNNGLGKLIFDNFIFELSKDQDFDIEFVCFKKNHIGNKFYKKMGIPINHDYKKTIVSKEMDEIINIYKMGNIIE